jgi:hypothetical protein
MVSEGEITRIDGRCLRAVRPVPCPGLEREATRRIVIALDDGFLDPGGRHPGDEWRTERRSAGRSSVGTALARYGPIGHGAIQRPTGGGQDARIRRIERRHLEAVDVHPHGRASVPGFGSLEGLSGDIRGVGEASRRVERLGQAVERFGRSDPVPGRRQELGLTT